MGDYTSRPHAQQTAAVLSRAVRLAALLVLAGWMAACAAPQTTAADIDLQVEADGGTTAYTIASGSTIQQALASAGVRLGELDRVDPPVFTVLTQDAVVRITRVVERFEVETETLPFERQTIRNEALPEGETRLLQPGVNGAQETTYRILVEEGGISRTPVKTTIQIPRSPRSSWSARRRPSALSPSREPSPTSPDRRPG
jgi:hypothetical protein